MKYVSDIKVNGKPVDYAEYPPLSCTDDITITIHDIETGETKKFNDSDSDYSIADCSFADCYGFSNGPDSPNCFVARHTNVAVQLYKYIKWVKIYYGSSMLPTGSANSCVSDMQDAPSRILEVYCGDNEVYSFRPFGSSVAVVYNDHDFIKAFSLYDFLMSMCRATNLNIMAYGAVRFFDFEEYRCTEIAFSHEYEAKKFFRKMYVMGNPEVSSEQIDKTIWPWVSDQSNLIVTTHDMESIEEQSFQGLVRGIVDLSKITEGEGL